MYQVGIIGCGEVAEVLLEQWPAEWKLEAVSNAPDRPQSEVWKGISWFEDFRDMLNVHRDIDLIVVCSPTGYHAEHVITSLQQRRSIVMVKPLCFTSSAAQQIMDTARFSGCQVRLMDVKMKDPCFELQGNELTIYHPKMKDWEQTLFPGGGVLYNHGTQGLQALTEKFGQTRITNGNEQQFLWNNEAGEEGKIHIKEVHNKIMSLEIEGPALTERFNPIPPHLPLIKMLENFYVPNQFEH